MIEPFKNLGAFGLVIGFLGFVLVFIQNSFDSRVIQDTIDYNLVYSINAISEFESENYVTVVIKNGGIKSLDSVRVKIKSLDASIKGLSLSDSLDSGIRAVQNDGVLKEIQLTLEASLYPTESHVALLSIDSEKRIKIEDFLISVNNEKTNGLRVDNAELTTAINYNNVELYVNGVMILLFYMLIRIVLPIVCLYFLYRLFMFWYRRKVNSN